MMGMKHGIVLCLLVSGLMAGCNTGELADDDDASSAPADLDGDGFTSDEDCDDTNPLVYPGADPICEAEDADCDGQPEAPPDEDGDGYAPCPGENTPADCDDTDPAINPGAVEVCDGVDNDCDGRTDNGFDQDGDSVTTCATPIPDCDDTNPAVYPGAREVCDGLDNDCDSQTDETSDNDGDGFTECSSPVPDCDDANPLVAPGLEEVCDGTDNDCDGDIDEGFDADEDGYSSCAPMLDCDDTNPDVHPDALEICDNDIDEDCDGVVATTGDGDGDGYDDCSGDPLDCDDENAEIYPGAVEACDFVDNDCDGETDEDQATDPNEPNDTPGSATDLGTINGQEATVTGALTQTTDQDWYKFYSMDDPDDLWLIRITLSGIPEGGNYDLFLYREEDLEEPVASGERTGDQPEELTCSDSGQEEKEENSNSGWYYIQVIWVEGTYGCPEYELTVYAG